MEFNFLVRLGCISEERKWSRRERGGREGEWDVEGTSLE
jgi:hypothetical protein